ncbi:hypothetical protein RJT34_08068 [Clitoria ternatea]|uniref:BRI1 kinase inhibitor 1-like n=1 Tax=Clitoria ternatea TaxID=43366 RepID=A0AAN9K5C4_CLITE
MAEKKSAVPIPSSSGGQICMCLSKGLLTSFKVDYKALFLFGHQKERKEDHRSRISDIASNLVSLQGNLAIMETPQNQHHQNNTEKDVEKPQQFEEASAKLLRQQEKQHKEDQSNSPPSSQSSSPSHEFSFTISLHSTTFPDINNTNSTNKATPSSHTLDLSPADDIFFHGHLLPLHLLSHFPTTSPRSSTNSMDSFTLPIRELLENENENPINNHSGSSYSSSSSNRSSTTTLDKDKNIGKNKRVLGGKKFKLAFSLFGLTKGHRGCQIRDKEDKEMKHMKNKKKLRFEVIHAVLKKYLRMVQPRMLFKGGQREKNIRPCGQAYSYSGNVTPRNYKQDLRGGWRGQYSAPASMRTSPTNSGLLLATTPLSPASDSTMEELQAAIQAAIAHCKNSFAKEDKLKC